MYIFHPVSLLTTEFIVQVRNSTSPFFFFNRIRISDMLKHPHIDPSALPSTDDIYSRTSRKPSKDVSVGSISVAQSATVIQT